MSLIILNRDGVSYLEQLFFGLRDNTEYSNFEVVLVDNGSSDGSVAVARSFRDDFPVRIMENKRNVTFSSGNNQGAEVAAGNLLLFLNNDVEPFEPGWLKELVSYIENSGAAATGARLLYPREVDPQTATGYTVQHRGIKFYRAWNARHPFNLAAYNLGSGEDALDEHLGEIAAYPAATGACLLVRREVFNAVGGFSDGYRYATEDTDLGLKLNTMGYKLFCNGRAVLFHKEFGTQPKARELARSESGGIGQHLQRVNRQISHRLLKERWGPYLNRKFLMARLQRTGFWSEGAAHIAIALTSHEISDGYGDWYVAHELGDAMEQRGWFVSYVQSRDDEWYAPPKDADYMLALTQEFDPSRVPGAITIAWIHDQVECWVERSCFEHFDVVLVASSTAKNLVEQSTSQAAKIFPPATNPDRFMSTIPNPTYEADYVFTGHYWGEEKPRFISNLDVEPDETVMIFGRGWERVPCAIRYARGYLPYWELPQVYSSTKLVVDEAGSVAGSYAAAKPGILDALSTGTLVITNRGTSVRELFDEEFPTYTNRQQLRGQLDLLLNDEEQRVALAQRYQEMVLREHTYENRAEQLESILCNHAESLSFCIKTGSRDYYKVPGNESHLAWATRRQFERRGYPCLVQILGEWDNFEGLKYDVVIHLKDSEPYTPKPSQFNVLWSISHQELVTPRECHKYDLVLVDSERLAEQLRPETSTPIVVEAMESEVSFLDPERELVPVDDAPPDKSAERSQRSREKALARDTLAHRLDLILEEVGWRIEEFGHRNRTLS